MPASPGGIGGCCGGPNNHCAADVRGFRTDPMWAALDFQIDEPSLFMYDYNGTSPTTFIAAATGDLDCDGTPIIYTLNGSAVGGNPAVTLTEPPPNTD
jgi:hypothetical protein